MLLKIKKSGQALLPTRYTCTTAKESGADNFIARQGVHESDYTPRPKRPHRTKVPCLSDKCNWLKSLLTGKRCRVNILCLVPQLIEFLQI